MENSMAFEDLKPHKRSDVKRPVSDAMAIVEDSHESHMTSRLDDSEMQPDALRKDTMTHYMSD